MLTKKTKLWIVISAASVILASTAAVVFTKPELFSGNLPAGGMLDVGQKIPTFQFTDDNTVSSVAQPAPQQVEAPNNVQSVAIMPTPQTDTERSATSSPYIPNSFNTDVILVEGESPYNITSFATSEIKTIGTIKMFSNQGVETKKLKRLIISMTCYRTNCTKRDLANASGFVSIKTKKAGETEFSTPSNVTPKRLNTTTGHSGIFDVLNTDQTFTIASYSNQITTTDIQVTFEPNANFPFNKMFTFKVKDLINTNSSPTKGMIFSDAGGISNVTAVCPTENLEPVASTFNITSCLDRNALIIGNIGPVAVAEVIPAPGFVIRPSISITNLFVDDITTNSAIVTWDTNLLSDSKIIYCNNSQTAIALCSSAGPENLEINTTKHIIELYNLSPNTLYRYQVQSKYTNDQSITAYDPARDTEISSWRTFTTNALVAGDPQPPPVIDDGPDELQVPVEPVRPELHIKRAQDTPSAAAIEPGAQDNVFKIRVFVPAGKPTARLNSITFTKIGTTPNEAFRELRLYEGGNRFDAGIVKILEDVDGTNYGTVTFTTDKTIRAGENVDFTLWIKLTDSAPADSTFYFSVINTDEANIAQNGYALFETVTGIPCQNDDIQCVRSENFVISKELVTYIPPPPPPAPPPPAPKPPVKKPDPPKQLSCEEQGKHTYSGPERAGRIKGMCISCSTNLYVATNGTCELNISGLDETVPETEVKPPAPTLENAPRLVRAPERSQSGPGMAIYFAIVGASNLAYYLKKRKKRV